MVDIPLSSKWKNLPDPGGASLDKVVQDHRLCSDDTTVPPLFAFSIKPSISRINVAHPRQAFIYPFQNGHCTDRAEVTISCGTEHVCDEPT